MSWPAASVICSELCSRWPLLNGYVSLHMQNQRAIDHILHDMLLKLFPMNFVKQRATLRASKEMSSWFIIDSSWRWSRHAATATCYFTCNKNGLLDSSLFKASHVIQDMQRVLRPMSITQWLQTTPRAACFKCIDLAPTTSSPPCNKCNASRERLSGCESVNRP